jgi:hypothetical protein
VSTILVAASEVLTWLSEHEWPAWVIGGLFLVVWVAGAIAEALEDWTQGPTDSTVVVCPRETITDQGGPHRG